MEGGPHIHVYLKYERPMEENGKGKVRKGKIIKGLYMKAKGLKKVSTRSKTIIAPGDENILYSKNMGGENNKE
jgi:hypothetical protein